MDVRTLVPARICSSRAAPLIKKSSPGDAGSEQPWPGRQPAHAEISVRLLPRVKGRLRHVRLARYMSPPACHSLRSSLTSGSDLYGFPEGTSLRANTEELRNSFMRKPKLMPAACRDSGAASRRAASSLTSWRQGFRSASSYSPLIHAPVASLRSAPCMRARGSWFWRPWRRSPPQAARRSSQWGSREYRMRNRPQMQSSSPGGHRRTHGASRGRREQGRKRHYRRCGSSAHADPAWCR